MFARSNTETDANETFLICLLWMQVRSEAHLNAKLIQSCLCGLSHSDSCTTWWLLILWNLCIILKSFEYADVLSDRFVFKYSLHGYGTGIAHLVKWLNTYWDRTSPRCYSVYIRGSFLWIKAIGEWSGSTADISWSYCKSPWCSSVITKHRTFISCEYLNAVLVRKILRQHNNSRSSPATVIKSSLFPRQMLILVVVCVCLTPCSPSQF